MHPKTILKILSILILILSLFMIVPAVVALIYKEYNAFYSFIETIIFTMMISILAIVLLKKAKEATLSTKDGFLLVTFGWFVAALLGSIPFYISGCIPSYVDAFFETISGFSTTGASILNDIESLPKSMLFWRSLTHWLGGMGIIVLTVAILPLMGIGGLQLIKAEMPGPAVDKISPRIADNAKYLWLIYIVLTIAETILLMYGNMNLFDALTHTFGTVATGGFSTKDSSIQYFDSPYIETVVTIFMLLAGINFMMHYSFVTGRFKTILKNSEIKVYLSIFILATFFITFNMNREMYIDVWESLRLASFQAASILTTTGYVSMDYQRWPYFAQGVLFMLMFVGGCSGSTAGGIKVIRITTLLKQAVNEMKYLLHPMGIFTLKANKHTVKKDIVYAISGFFFLYIAIALLLALIVSTSGVSLSTSLSSAVAILGNIGPGFGNVGPASNYYFYPDYVKWALSFGMLAGRLEIYTVLVIFTPFFWKK